MKRKLLLTIVASFAIVFGGQTAKAYSTNDLTTAGWTQVTAGSITGNDNNYYILVDAYSSEYVMANDATNYRPRYKAIADPLANPSFVWILEGNENNFALKSYSTGAYFKQSDGWNTSVGNGRGGAIATCKFTLQDGKYTIKCVESDGLVGHWNDNGPAVASDGEDIAANKNASNAPGFYLYSIPKSAFDTALAKSRIATVATATKASPADVTSYIQNADWSNDWGGWEFTCTSSGNTQWGGKTFESWKAENVILKQELQGIPNGRYKLIADVISGPNTTMAAYVYAIGNKKVSSDVVSATASADNYGTMSNEVAGKTLTADNINVTDNVITVGIDQSTGWIVADNFKLYYYGPNLATVEALPEESNITANTWYYFDIAIEGTYNITCSTLNDIVYSTDGTILIEDGASVTTKFSGSSVELPAGRYYVKSSSAQKLAVTPSSYSYEVGDATSSIAEGNYQKSLTTVTFAFTEAASNDPDAKFTLLDNTAVVTLKKAGEDVKTGELSLEGTTLTATFSEVTLDMASTYSIELPANVVGYAGEAQNAALTVNFNTPAIADGLYYFYNTYTNNYLSRGGNYGTQAILDNYGVPALLEFNAEGKTRIKFFDNHKFLSDGGELYADNTTGGLFYVEEVEDGYKFKDVNSNKYVAVNGSIIVGDAVEGDNLEGTSNIWALETPTEYQAKDNATILADQQAVEAATAAGLYGIYSLADLEGELAANYDATDITITGAKAEKYNVNAGGKPLKENEYVKENISDLEPGIYRLTVDAFQRASSNERVAAADGASSLVYVYAGSAKTQIKSVMHYGADEAYSSDFAYNGKHYPNDETCAYQALATGNYTSTVYVYVADEGEGKGSLTFGINNPQNTNAGGWPNALWAAYNNFTLTRYDMKKVEVPMVVDAEYKWATFCAPFDVTIPEGVTAYTVDGVLDATERTLDMTEVKTTIPANTPVVLYSAKGVNETFTDVPNYDGDPHAGLLFGVYDEKMNFSDYPNDAIYLLSQPAGCTKVAFYPVDKKEPEPTATTGYTTYNMQYKAFLWLNYHDYQDGPQARGFFLDGEDNGATAIEGVDVLTSGEYDAIYNAAGIPVETLQKGLNIVVKDGKSYKIYVK